MSRHYIFIHKQRYYTKKRETIYSQFFRYKIQYFNQLKRGEKEKLIGSCIDIVSKYILSFIIHLYYIQLYIPSLPIIDFSLIENNHIHMCIIYLKDIDMPISISLEMQNQHQMPRTFQDKDNIRIVISLILLEGFFDNIQTKAPQIS